MNSLTFSITKIDDTPTKAKPKPAPFTPYHKESAGTKNQVRAVHITINLNVKEIFPIALSIFVKGVVTAANAEVIEIKLSAVKAGVHLVYFGIIWVKEGASKTKSTSEGKTKRQMKKIDLETALDNSTLSSCILENAGKVTFIT